MKHGQGGDCGRGGCVAGGIGLAIMTKIHPLSSLVLLMKNGTTAEQNQEGRGFPTTRIETISDGSIDLNRVRFVELDSTDVERWIIQQGDILLSHINSVEHIGKSAIYCGIPEILIHGMNLLLLRPDRSLVLPEYLHFGLRSHEIREHIRARCKRAINQASINQKEIGAIELLVPSLNEQRRIVDILSRAEGIVRLRREAQKKAAEIIPALFIDMFGDPATNPKGWPIVPFSKFGNCRLGKMLDKKKQSGQFQKPYLRNVNVQWDRIDTYDLLEMDFRPDEQNNLRLKAGDVLICEGGEIGRAAIWNSQMKECYYQKALHRLQPDTRIIRADFVIWLFWHLARSGAFTGSKTQATIAHLTGVQLKSLQVICPTVAVQDEFERRVAECHSIQSQQFAATQKAEATFNALLSRAFQGELA